MKIGNLLEQLRTERKTNQSTERARTATPAGGENVGAADKADAPNTVALSTASRELSAAGASSTGDEIDLEKVAAMKAAIEQGSFRVDGGKVADRLIEQTSELLNLKSRS